MCTRYTYKFASVLQWHEVYTQNKLFSLFYFTFFLWLCILFCFIFCNVIKEAFKSWTIYLNFPLFVAINSSKNICGSPPSYDGKHWISRECCVWLLIEQLRTGDGKAEMRCKVEEKIQVKKDKLESIIHKGVIKYLSQCNHLVFL